MDRRESNAAHQRLSAQPIPLLLLEEQPNPLPKWMKFYVYFSCVIYVLHMIYSVGYLVFVGFIQSENILHIQYEPVFQFLQYNSYSLMCPLLVFLIIPILIYQTRKKIKLDDGDFFGIIGVLLLLTLICTYDATGVLNLYSSRSDYLENIKTLKEIEPYNDNEPNELAWQYAWSTKPTCARVHAINIEKIQKEKRKLDEDEGFTNGPVTIDELHDEEKEKSNEFMYKSRNAIEKDHGNSANEIAYKKECNSTSDSIDKTSSRDWMEDMQIRFKCCGPRGYIHWTLKVNDISTTCPPKQSVTVNDGSDGCAKPFNNYLKDLLYKMMIVIYIEAAFYLVSIIVACFHFAAMKYDGKGLVKEYSLLNLDVDKNIKHLGNTPTSILLKDHGKSDPVENLFHQANLRLQKEEQLVVPSHGGPRAFRRMSLSVATFTNQLNAVHNHPHSTHHKGGQ